MYYLCCFGPAPLHVSSCVSQLGGRSFICSLLEPDEVRSTDAEWPMRGKCEEVGMDGWRRMETDEDEWVWRLCFLRKLPSNQTRGQIYRFCLKVHEINTRETQQVVRKVSKLIEIQLKVLHPQTRLELHKITKMVGSQEILLELQQ